jgi:uncharacterized repeat protein (TIGR03806 family)
MAARYVFSATIVFASAAAFAACSSSKSAPGVVRVSPARLSSCIAGARPSTGTKLVPALNDVGFDKPVALVFSPVDSTRAYVVEKTGLIKRASRRDGSTTVFADLRSRISSEASEAGLLGFALHPRFATHPYVYVSYTKPSATSPVNLASVIARGESKDGGLMLDPASLVELLTVDQPFENHNGGHLAFSNDGYLLIGFGDGGSGGDPQGNAQNTDVLLGKILRIDVDRGGLYAIPPGNPFARGGGAPEVFAFGFRNPWRFTVDRMTGELWAGDVGQGKFEEIDRVTSGGNYGWNVREGKHCYETEPCELPGAIDPVIEYDHTQGISVTGGYVYRGAEIPELYGHYIYGDYGSGRIWSFRADESTPSSKLLLESGLAISSFAEDPEGEVYVLDYAGGKVRKFALDNAYSTIATELSKTGCFEASDPRVPAAGLIRYEVNSPLWSDGAEKHRWMSLPIGQTATLGPEGHLEFPPGSVLVKEFRLGGKRIETRLFMRHTDGEWAGYSYEWNDAETDATLVPDGKEKTVAGQTWTYPTQAQCMTCHNAAARRTLGLEIAQLHRPILGSDGVKREQLDTLRSEGAFAEDMVFPLPLEALLDPSDASKSVESRARSYLHGNCANCHRPQGPGRGSADLRFSVRFADTKLCNALPETESLGISGAKLLVPGNPGMSLVSLRMHRLDEARMPPLSSHAVDPLGTSVVDAFIRSLASCP